MRQGARTDLHHVRRPSAPPWAPANEPFLKEHQLSLTVVPAYSYITDTLKVFGIPQNWIVDSNGVVRLKGLGYDSTEKWETGMREAIEKYKPEAKAAAPPPAPQDRKAATRDSGGRATCYISRRPSIAFSMVTSSANSSSEPTGMPVAMRVTLMPRGLISFER